MLSSSFQGWLRQPPQGPISALVRPATFRIGPSLVFRPTSITVFSIILAWLKRRSNNDDFDRKI